MKKAFEKRFVNKKDSLTRWGHKVKNRSLKVGLKEKEVLSFIAEREALARETAIKEALACVEKNYPMDASDTPIGVMRVHSNIKLLLTPDNKQEI